MDKWQKDADWLLKTTESLTVWWKSSALIPEKPWSFFDIVPAVYYVT